MRPPKPTTSSSSSSSSLGNERPITVTVTTACKVSGLGTTSIWARISDGTLATVQVGRRRLILYESLLRLLTPASSADQSSAQGKARPFRDGKAVAP